MILSLLFDHCFLLHPEQSLSIKKQASLATFGSLLERSRMEAFIKFMQHFLEKEHPKKALEDDVGRSIGLTTLGNQGVSP